MQTNINFEWDQYLDDDENSEALNAKDSIEPVFEKSFSNKAKSNLCCCCKSK